MFVQVTRTQCTFVIKAEDKFSGRTVKCPNCKAHLKMPDPRVQQAIPSDPLIGKQTGGKTPVTLRAKEGTVQITDVKAE